MAQKNERTLDITNQFMFRRVMQDEAICKGFLEAVLGVRVERIVYHNVEQTIDTKFDLKSVRLDLYLKDEGRVYDVEMQAQPRHALGRRFRYYQSSIDATLLPKGRPYQELSESYIIFLCTYDPFERALPIYTFDRVCVEEDFALDCAARWMVLNCTAYERACSLEVRNLLQYVENGEVVRGDGLVEAMDAAVREANHDKEWVDMAFSVSTVYEDIEREARYNGLQQGLEEGRKEGLEEGRKEGRKEGRAEGVVEGEARLSRLVRELLSADRLADIERVTADVAYRAKLFEEFGIA